MIFFVKNKGKINEKVNFSLESFEYNNWREIDNDIFRDEPKVFKYFILKPDKKVRICFYLKTVEPNLFKKNSKYNYRIVLNTYPNIVKGGKKIPFGIFKIRD